jgi:internalin A
LVLGGNKINSISPKLSNLEELVLLYLNQMPLTKLPSSIGKLKKLEVLSLSNNAFPEQRIRNFPKSMTNLKNIKNLDLSELRLKKFPQWICSLTALEVLDLRGNEITTLPDCLKKLNHLKEIKSGDNEIPTEVIDAFFKLKNEK